MGIVAVGSVAFDTIQTPHGKREEILGGSASYFCVAASYFGDVRMLSVVGDDFPEAHAQFFRSKGIDLGGLERRAGKTFRWQAVYGDDMNERRTLAADFNVYGAFAPCWPREAAAGEMVFLASIDPDLQRAWLQGMQAPRLVACDTIYHWIEDKGPTLLAMLPQIDMLIINESEARALAGEVQLMPAARKLLACGLKRLIVKRGSGGAMMLGPQAIFCLPAFPVECVIDPTGAGDAFAGGLLGYLAACNSLDEAAVRRAMAYGTVMASFCVMDFGLKQLGDLTFTEIESRYREFCRITRFAPDAGPEVGAGV